MKSLESQSMIFLGNGDRSSAECYAIHQRLELCFMYLGGSQQPLHRDQTFTEKVQSNRESIFIENTVRDIAFALTGKPIKFIGD